MRTKGVSVKDDATRWDPYWPCTDDLGKPSRQQNLFVPFPGLNEANPFRCNFYVDDGALRGMPRRDIE